MEDPTDDNIEFLLNPKGKNCKTCHYSGYEKGDEFITCGVWHHNFKSESGCDEWKQEEWCHANISNNISKETAKAVEELVKEAKIQLTKKNCEGCSFYKYNKQHGHGWCYAEGQYSGKLRGNGPSCILHTGTK